eukprot:Nitzschia sp. Nitz4//scaffold19_size178191//21323//22619//NITZ4_001958-RA/size178191-augustus-gene-0.97-mRNA-1//-1//CDS//3329540622//6969//frame0
MTASKATFGRVVALLGCLLARQVECSVYIKALSKQRSYDSVTYFDFSETKWPYLESGDILEGHIEVLTGEDFDEFFNDYQENSPWVNHRSQNSTTEVQISDEMDFEFVHAPTFMMVEFSSSEYSASLDNIRRVALWRQVDGVLLVANNNAGRYEQFRFWWSHKFPGVPQNEVNWVSQESNDVIFAAVGADQGQVMMEILREYELLNLTRNEIYFGVDDLDPMKGSVFCRQVCFYVMLLVLFWRLTKMIEAYVESQEDDEAGEGPYVQFTGEDLGMGEVQASELTHDCCICLETMQPGEKVRILPCRHLFHHDCINGWFAQRSYVCPMCKMDLRSHLAERRNANAELAEIVLPPRTFWQRLWPWSAIKSIDPNALLGDIEINHQAGMEVEMTEDSFPPSTAPTASTS